jgi:hypothetical protein
VTAAEETSGRSGAVRKIPEAAAFAAFPLVEGNISLKGEEGAPSGQAENESIGNIRQASFLGAQSNFHDGPGIDPSVAPPEPKLAAPLYELQSLLARQEEKREESGKPELEGEKLPEDYKLNREGLQMRIRILEDELSELRDSVVVMKRRDVKVKAFLDYVNVLGSYYMKNCKYYDQEGWCTNWFWNVKPNFENPDGSKVATRRGEDGKYYIKPNVFICSLCNAATSKFWA